MIDTWSSTRARNVWSSVALVEVRVMMAFTMSIGETLLKLCLCCMGRKGIAVELLVAVHSVAAFVVGGQHGNDKDCR